MLCLSCVFHVVVTQVQVMTFFFLRVSPLAPEIWAVCGSQYILWREPFSPECWREGERLASGGGGTQARYLELGEVE